MAIQARLLALFFLAASAQAQLRTAVGTLGVERGGSCGYSENYPPPGVFIGGFSAVLYQAGAACGACYVATCVQSAQCTNKPVSFMVTNQCLGDNSTSPCVTGRSGLALQPEAFDVIATSRAPGIVPMRYQQVPCRAAGGVQFVVQSDPGAGKYYFAVLIQNVAGPGSLAGVGISTNGRVFQPMSRSYGAVWEANNFNVVGAPLSFRLTGSNGQVLTIVDAIPAAWEADRLYPALTNFDLPIKAVPAKKKILPAKLAAAAAVKKGQAKRAVSRVPEFLTPSRAAMATLGEESGGACGFLNYPAPTTFQAGFSTALYRDGANCGGCFLVSCANSAQCIPGAVRVQVSNLCTATNTTSVCTEGQAGINMQPEAWDKIVSSRSPGIVSVTYQQVSCAGASAGGVQFLVRDGSPMYFSTLIQNVGGAGSLVGVDIAFGATAFQPMTRSFGSVWAYNGRVVTGAPVSFRLTTVGGYKLTLTNALPANWVVGKRVYTSLQNF